MLQLLQQDDLIEQMIPVAHQFFPDLLNMNLVTCLQRHRHNAGIDLCLCIFAFMGNIQNVCPCFRNTGQQLCQVACLVRQFGLQLDNASCLLQALCDDASASVFLPSNRATIAAAISSSLTVTMSSTYC